MDLLGITKGHADTPRITQFYVTQFKTYAIFKKIEITFILKAR